MDTRAMASEYRLTQWAQRMQAKAQMGQSIGEFCSEAGISRNTYFYWQRKLREAACTALMNKGDCGEKGVPEGWARLTPQARPPENSGVTIEVNGCRVTATSENELELLLKVCRMLKAL